MNYLARLSTGRFILWCYFVWWSVILVRYFDPSPRLWLTSLGLSFIIGLVLYINTSASGKTRVRLETWQFARLFIIPFCVSSFAALIKGQGFILVFSPRWEDSALAGGLCAILGGFVALARRLRPLPSDTASR